MYGALSLWETFHVYFQLHMAYPFHFVVGGKLLCNQKSQSLADSKLNALWMNEKKIYFSTSFLFLISSLFIWSDFFFKFQQSKITKWSMIPCKCMYITGHLFCYTGLSLPLLPFIDFRLEGKKEQLSWHNFIWRSCSTKFNIGFGTEPKIKYICLMRTF